MVGAHDRLLCLNSTWPQTTVLATILLLSIRASQSSETRLAQTVSILLSNRRQLSLVDLVRDTPAQIGGLTGKRRPAFSTVFFDAHTQQIKRIRPRVSSAVKTERNLMWDGASIEDGVNGSTVPIAKNRS